MASVSIMTVPSSSIHYSMNGHVNLFVLCGITLYDEQDGTEADGWEDKLIEFVREQELNIDHDGHGLHAFVYSLQERGLLNDKGVTK